ncbi:hypothetical protein B484DRAFT_417182 [Ochromonadaceae sp. CCMP2298]|nr:hypothetical protein B484DRAFT_417182 [Ochromonadaceae sp. CCMP2298]
MDSSNSMREQELIAKLMSKVSEQALELGDLSLQLDHSRAEAGSRGLSSRRGSLTVTHATPEYNAELESHRAESQEQKEQLLDLQRALETAETRLEDTMRGKKKLAMELEGKSRESAFYLQKCQSLQEENKGIRHELNYTQKDRLKGVGLKKGVTEVDRTTGVQGVGVEGRGINGEGLDAGQFMQLCEELKQSQGNLHKCQKELLTSQDREGTCLKRVRALEDALEVRAEQIGLAGHADLLAKVARLRGEVGVLRRELGNEGEEGETKGGGADLQGHEVLQRHAQGLQSRLSRQGVQGQGQGQGGAWAGEELQRLRRAQQERDQLLTIVQSELGKSATMAERVESLGVELREARADVARGAEAAEVAGADLIREKERGVQWQQQCTKADLQVQELQHQVDLLGAEKHTLSTQFDRKSTESDELNRMQMRLFVQAQGKEEQLERKSEEVLQLRGLYATTEVGVLRQSVAVLEPNMARLEPELNLLRKEKAKWDVERYELQTELDKLRPVGVLLGEIGREIGQLNALAAGEDAGGGDEGKVEGSMGGSGGGGGGVGMGVGVSLSQRHSLWVGLPSIRHLHPPLYENIRRLSSDLSIAEAHLHTLAAALAGKNADLLAYSRQHEVQFAQLSAAADSSAATQQRLSEALRVAEKEAGGLRGNRIVVDQIRCVLASHPGSFADLRLGELVGREEQGQREENSSGSGGSGGSPSSWASALRSREDVEALLAKVSDTALPDLLGRALMHNASSVMEARSACTRVNTLERRVVQAGEEIAELQRIRGEISAALQEAQTAQRLSQQGAEQVRGQCFLQLEGATDLAEKQNQLTMTLEAKIEKLHRDRQLKHAQLTAFQQRESALKSRLHASLNEYQVKTGVTGAGLPLEGCKLVDLVHKIGDVLHNLARTGSGERLRQAQEAFSQLRENYQT